MFAIKWRKTVMKSLLSGFVLLALMLTLSSCRETSQSTAPLPARHAVTKLSTQIAEVAPPEPIQKLRQSLERYQPQVTIASPQPGEVLQDTKVSVRLQVQDLPIFKSTVGLGPHLHVVLDNQPYRAVYDLDQPLVLEDISPGTHTLRVFASRPWHESFKNEGAYAQTTFHIFAKTQENALVPALPLLTYSRPTGTYGAEPIMLDFYLTNAPLHLVAQEKPEDDLVDWRIRCTVNGESFIVDRWEPIYLKGFKRGKNWVQIEYLDETGNPINNAFNNTVRLINYEPNGKDALSKLIRGELSASQTQSLLDPNYTEPAVSPEPVPTPSPAPAAEPAPSLEVMMTPENPPLEKDSTDAPEATPSLTPATSKELSPTDLPAVVLDRASPSSPEPTPLPVAPSPVPTSPARKSMSLPGQLPEVTLEPLTPPLPQPAPKSLATEVEKAEVDPLNKQNALEQLQPKQSQPELELSPPEKTTPTPSKPNQSRPNWVPSEFFNRFKHLPFSKPEATPTLLEIVNPPVETDLS